MMRSVALFALLAGASALESADILVKTSELLEKKLASFESKDLKDEKVYEDYVKVREEAKKAAAALEKAAEKQAKDPEAQKPQMKEKTDEETAEEILYRDDEESEDEEQAKKILEESGEDAMALKDSEKEQPEADDKTAKKSKARNLMKKQTREEAVRTYLMKKAGLNKTTIEKKLEELEERKEQNLKNFQSPYRAASLKDNQQIEVKDEGKGNYGKFGKIILEETGASSLIEEEPKTQVLSLEDTIAKREGELRHDAVLHKKAIQLAKKAEDLCGTDAHCKETVAKKLKHGAFDRQLKAMEEKGKSKKQKQV